MLRVYQVHAESTESDSTKQEDGDTAGAACDAPAQSLMDSDCEGGTVESALVMQISCVSSIGERIGMVTVVMSASTLSVVFSSLFV